jgi:alpha-tubulin suppressor-like RCC1 family protein
MKNKKFSFAATGRFHSVLVDERNVYTCGRNFGQIGQPREKREVNYFQKVVPIDNCGNITKLVSSDGAVAVFTQTVQDTENDSIYNTRIGLNEIFIGKNQITIEIPMP